MKKVKNMIAFNDKSNSNDITKHDWTIILNILDDKHSDLFDRIEANDSKDKETIRQINEIADIIEKIERIIIND